MESQPQNPEFRNNPENFHPCLYNVAFISCIVLHTIVSVLIWIQTVCKSYQQMTKIATNRGRDKG